MIHVWDTAPTGELHRSDAHCPCRPTLIAQPDGQVLAVHHARTFVQQLNQRSTDGRNGTTRAEHAN